MDDKACRLEILRIFKECHDQRPNNYISRKERFTSRLCIEENVLDRNVKYLADKGLLEVNWIRTNKFQGQITARGIDFLETGEPSGLAILSPLTIHQEFHASVGVVAGKDIKIQISFNEVLTRLTKNIEANPKISLEEKRSLMDKLKSLSENGWIQSVGTSVLGDLIKKAVGL